MQRSDLPNKLLITVCAECLQASCWQAVFMCDKSRTADIIDLPVSRLLSLNLEHPDWWTKDPRAIEWRQRGA